MKRAEAPRERRLPIPGCLLCAKMKVRIILSKFAIRQDSLYLELQGAVCIINKQAQDVVFEFIRDVLLELIRDRLLFFVGSRSGAYEASGAGHRPERADVRVELLPYFPSGNLVFDIHVWFHCSIHTNELPIKEVCFEDVTTEVKNESLKRLGSQKGEC